MILRFYILKLMDLISPTWIGQIKMMSAVFLGKKFDAQEKVITEHETVIAHLRE